MPLSHTYNRQKQLEEEAFDRYLRKGKIIAATKLLGVTLVLLTAMGLLVYFNGVVYNSLTSFFGL